MKKIISVLLALVMTLALSVSALAAGTNTITVTGAQKDETYNIYKMLDLSVDLDKGAYTYTVNEKWAAFFAEGGAGAAYVTITNGYVTWKDDKKDAVSMEAFGKAAAAYVADKSITPAVIALTPDADKNITFEGLDSGYYLITSTNGTLAMTATTPKNPNATINEKNPDSTIDKKVQEDSTGKWGTNNSAQIGDTVNFQVTITVKKGAKNYVMHDKMDDGLTPNINSITVNGLTKGTEYTVAEKPSDGCTFHVVFTQSYLDTITADTALTITYSAVLNEKAEVGTSENNKAQLTWGNNSSTTWVNTQTDTYQFAVLKYAANDNEKNPLAGATFQLKDANGNVVKLIKISDTEYRVANGNEAGAVESFITVGSGNVTIKGVDLDKYTLVETSAPAGYNLLKDPVEVTVGADNALVVEVANQSGTELPSTGGMGTTIFYVLGGVLMAGAFVLLVVRKRMRTE